MTLQEKCNVETMDYFIRLYIIMRVCERASVSRVDAISTVAA